MTTFLIVVLVSLGVAVATVAWMWHALRQSQNDYLVRLDQQESEIADLRQQIHSLYMERIVDRAYMQQWIEHGRRGWQKWSELSGQPPPAEPDETGRARPPTPNELAQLAKSVAARFSLEEIDGLAFELDATGAVSGDTVEARARALVDVARRRGLVLRLIELCRRERPTGGF